MWAVATAALGQQDGPICVVIGRLSSLDRRCGNQDLLDRRDLECVQPVIRPLDAQSGQGRLNYNSGGMRSALVTSHKHRTITSITHSCGIWLHGRADCATHNAFAWLRVCYVGYTTTEQCISEAHDTDRCRTNPVIDGRVDRIHTMTEATSNPLIAGVQLQSPMARTR